MMRDKKYLQYTGHHTYISAGKCCKLNDLSATVA